MIEVTISGDRQSGKSTVASAIKHMLEKAGAHVAFTDETVEHTLYTTNRLPDLKSSTREISKILHVKLGVLPPDKRYGSVN